jgi:hypothetical protein
MHLLAASRHARTSKVPMTLRFHLSYVTTVATVVLLCINASLLHLDPDMYNSTTCHLSGTYLLHSKQCILLPKAQALSSMSGTLQLQYPCTA